MSYWPTPDTDPDICVWCGGPSAGRYCSVACYQAEDGRCAASAPPHLTLWSIEVAKQRDLIDLLPTGIAVENARAETID